MQERVVTYAKEFGLEGLNPPERSPNTRKVLAIAERARDRGVLDRFRDVAMNAYWRDGRDLGDLDTLIELAGRVGLTADDVRAAIVDPELLARLDRARQAAEDRGVTGIPTFFIGPYRVVGCQPYEVLAEAVAAAALIPGEGSGVTSPALRVFSSSDLACEALADELTASIRARPAQVLALPTGRSPLPLYRALVLRHRQGALDLGRVHTFNLDEFVGLGAQHPSSYRAYMERHLFSQVNLAPERIHFLDGAAPDLDAECARYDAELAAAGGLDLAILGVGENGHLAFNEPGATLHARTHRTKIARATREANAMLFGGEVADVPLEALTLGLAPILQARKIAVLAFGPSKRAAVAAMQSGVVDPRVPATLLQLHRDVDRVRRSSGRGGALSSGAHSRSAGQPGGNVGQPGKPKRTTRQPGQRSSRSR